MTSELHSQRCRPFCWHMAFEHLYGNWHHHSNQYNNGHRLIFVAAIPNVDVQNYMLFFPKDAKVTTICRGVSLLYYAYLGFDSLASVAEDAQNPSRNLPIAIVVCLVVCIILYSLLATAFIGIVSWAHSRQTVFDRIDEMDRYKPSMLTRPFLPPSFG